MTIPKSYICSITQEIMKDPVMCPEGHSYERQAIENWVAVNQSSPITRNRLWLSDLTPNRALKDSISDFMIDHTELVAGSLNGNIINIADNATTITANSNNQRQPSTLAVNVSYHDGHLLINHQVTNMGQTSAPCDLVATIDISGSMGADATRQTDATSVERDGLSQLDIVKHAVKTIISTLTDQDRLCLVSYHTQAKVELEFTTMDSRGKQLATNTLDQLQPQCTTNIWDGILTSLNAIKISGRPGCQAAVILLTDGVPNVVPPRGHEHMLERYLDQNPEMKATIHTCGFGYNLESPLLSYFANQTQGIYSFIPDSSFVGTVMVNLLSNIMAVAVREVEVSLELEADCVVADQSRQLSNVTPTSWGATYKLSNINYGQAKDTLIILDKFAGQVTVTTKYQDHATEKSELSTITTTEVDNLSEKTDHFQNQLARLKVVEIISDLLTLNVSNLELSGSERLLTSLKQYLTSLPLPPTTYLKALIEDVNGQVTQAVSRQEWYNKWGKHYLPSLQRAHHLQITNNFKDPGVQHYAGYLFRDIQDMADDIFCKLPPPVPSNRGSSYSNGSQSGSYRSSSSSSNQINMSNYYSSSAPCFAGSSLVLMSNGSSRRVDSLIKGERVRCDPKDPSKTAAIVCILKTIISEATCQMVLMPDGLLVTPWHPVKVAGKWQFPIHLADCNLFSCETVYSFLLDTHHTISINNLECICLAHNYQEDILEHPYFGTSRVVKDLQRFPGWNTGLVTIYQDYIKRDIESTLVTEISFLEC